MDYRSYGSGEEVTSPHIHLLPLLGISQRLPLASLHRGQCCLQVCTAGISPGSFPARHPAPSPHGTPPSPAPVKPDRWMGRKEPRSPLTDISGEVARRAGAQDSGRHDNQRWG